MPPKEAAAGGEKKEKSEENSSLTMLVGAVLVLAAALAYSQLNAKECSCDEAIAAALEKSVSDRIAEAKKLVLERGLVDSLESIYELRKENLDPFAMSAVARAAVQGDIAAVRLLLDAAHALEPPAGGSEEQKEAFENLKVRVEKNERIEKEFSFTEDAKRVVVQSGYVTKLSDINNLQKKPNDPFAMPPLTRAAIGNDNEGVRALLAAGALPDVPTEHKVTALMAAAMGGNLEGVSILLEKGADIDAQDIHQVTALMQASLGGHAEVVEALMKAGANPNLQDKQGTTALHRAASKGFESVLKSLLKAKRTNVRIAAQNRNTPLMTAQAAGHAGAVKVIKKYMMIK
mmetsp:Transcript_58316/g.136879  ORF Transcript_58316/g.136879 Transcript_58316/m.136879 type:complete len:346 (-) Transcript_58316:105-1142(-)